MKTCTRCHETKPTDDFYRRKDGRLLSRCKVCMRALSRQWHAANPEKGRESNRRRRRTTESRRAQRYGITRQQLKAMLAEQGGRCAICRQPPEPGKVLAVDHDHSCCPGRFSCGRCVRGLLCARCNTLLGKVRDDPDRLHDAAYYVTPETPGPTAAEVLAYARETGQPVTFRQL